MPIIVDGKKIASSILDRLKIEILSQKKQSKPLVLAVVLVGKDQSSVKYVQKKAQAAKEIGLDFLEFNFTSTITKDRLINEIKNIQGENKLSGLIVQLPLPANLEKHTREIVGHIRIDLDVDCLSPLALGLVLVGKSKLLPPTPAAILEILKYYNVDLKYKKICLIGRGDLIGKPLAAMLLNQPVALSIHDQSTENLREYTKLADVIITGVGKRNILTGDMVKQGVIVIDAGISFEDDKIFGDVDFKSVSDKSSIITPVPGGVGPITVAKLLENAVLASSY